MFGQAKRHDATYGDAASHPYQKYAGRGSILEGLYLMPPRGIS
jgi:hypothetical protein